MPKQAKYLQSRRQRGRWFHHYRRGGKLINLGVHGLHPTDPAVWRAYCVEHARYEDSPPDTPQTRTGTFAWGVEVYLQSEHWKDLSEGTREARTAILKRYVDAQGDRPLSSITRDHIEAALYAKSAHAAKNEYKALHPLFQHLTQLRIIPNVPTKGVELRKPKAGGFITASIAEMEAFTAMYQRGSRERLIFDLALFTGAARVDLVKLGRRNIADGLLTYTRQKTGGVAEVPVTADLLASIAHLPDIAPAFIMTEYGKPRTANGLGTFFAGACKRAGVSFRLHGLRKAFCTYWAEQGATTHQIAAMAGHKSLSEVEVYTREADRKRLVRMLAER
jgi:integrase